MKQATTGEKVLALVVLAKLGGVRRGDGPRPTETPCYNCKNYRSNDHTHHGLCAKPCASVAGSPHGIERGWFMYPLEYDPVWRTSECENFDPADTQSVSQSVKQSAEQSS